MAHLLKIGQQPARRLVLALAVICVSIYLLFVYLNWCIIAGILVEFLDKTHYL